MRLLAVATAKRANAIILKEMVKEAGKEIEFLLDLGNMESDIKASSMVRLNMKIAKGKKHIMEGTKYTGALQAIESQGVLEKDISEFIDHLFRKDNRYYYRSHNLFSLQDYMDYYHILFDVMSAKIIENRITHMAFFNIPHLGYDTICYQIGKALGLEIIITIQSPFPNHYFSMHSVEDYGLLSEEREKIYEAVKIEPKENEWFYMKGIKQGEDKKGKVTWNAFGSISKFLLLTKPSYLLRPFKLYSILKRTIDIYGKLPEWRDPFSRFFHTNELEYFEHITQYEENKYDLEEDFVYFSLQMQPEMTTSALGGWYRDQALAIESLALLLPDTVKIYVKENPKQGAYMRGPMFFHRLKRIPSVVILPSYTNTHTLTDKSLFVSTISGTVGWEAIQKGKKVLIFGKTWYRSFPGVFEYHESLTYEEIINYTIQHEELEDALGLLLNKSHTGVVDRHYAPLVKDYDKHSNFKNVAKTILGLLQGREDTTFRDQSTGL